MVTVVHMPRRGDALQMEEEKRLKGRMCWTCYNFEDRRDIDGKALCAKGHTPGLRCEDYIARDRRLGEIKLKERFCWSCSNFEDRRCIEGALLCGRGHFPKDGCDDFVDRTRKLKEIGDNNRYERAMIRAILMERNNFYGIFAP